MTARPIYLDYAATTPTDSRVVKKMMHYLSMDGAFGNSASNSHEYGWEAEQAVNQARIDVAELIGANPKEIIWTSGATESNNLAIKGAMSFQQKKGKHIITSKTEHKAVLDTCAFLMSQGYEVTYLEPDENGMITIDAVKKATRDDTVLVSVMYANNETGIINDIGAIGKFTREQGIIFHVDGSQIAGKKTFNVNDDNIDLLSLTAHKVYGPKGIGAIFVRRKPRIRLHAQIHGGGHERGFRSGTLATHQIVGMGEAYRLATQSLEADESHIASLSERLWSGISDISGVCINGEKAHRLGNVLNIQFADVDGAALIRELKGLAVSSGSACISASSEASYVLRAMGLSNEEASRSVRFSFGRMTTTSEIDEAIVIIRAATSKLRLI